MKFRKKPVIVEAMQWFKAGDHLNVHQYRLPFEYDPYRHNYCEVCGKHFNEHGLINTLEGDLIVCPGAWIITGIKGEVYPCKTDIFEATYERVEDEK